MPDGLGEEKTVKVVKNGEGGAKRAWKLATRNQAHSGRAPRLSSSEGSRGRSAPVSRAFRIELRPDTGSAGAGGRPTDDHPWSGLEAGSDGSRAGMFPPGSDQAPPPEGPGTNRTRWDIDGRHLVSARHSGPRSRIERDRTANRRCPACLDGRTQVARRAAARWPSTRGRSPPGSPNYPSRQPTRRLSGSGWRSDPTGCPLAGESPSGGRSAGSDAIGRMPARDLVPGSTFSEMGALKGRRTSWEDVRCATRSTSTGKTVGRCRKSVPEGGCKATRGAMPIDYPVGATIAGNTPRSSNCQGRRRSREAKRAATDVGSIL